MHTLRSACPPCGRADVVASSIPALRSAAGSKPALALPFNSLAAVRAWSGLCVSGLPIVSDFVAKRFPVDGSTPRGL